MTLIATFNCADGFVLAGDSEENYGPYRRAVQKIKPRTIGGLTAIIAGSGIGPLIDSFIVRLERIQVQFSDVDSFARYIEGELTNFYARDVATYQAAEGEDKEHSFIVAVHDKRVDQCRVWGTRHATLEPVTTYALVGVEDALYHHAAERFYSQSLQLPQGVLTALYVLAIGEATSVYIRRPFHVAVISNNGIWLEDDSYVAEVSNRLREYEKRVNKIFLDCADSTIPLHQLQAELGQFAEAATALHKEQIDRYVQSLTPEQVASYSRPYPKTPLGQPIIFHLDGSPAVTEHDPNRDLDVYARAARERFCQLGYVEHFSKTLPGDKYAVSVSGRWENQPHQLIAEMTREEFITYCKARDMVPSIGPERFIQLLAEESSEAYFYLRPKQSVSQKSA